MSCGSLKEPSLEDDWCEIFVSFILQIFSPACWVGWRYEGWNSNCSLGQRGRDHILRMAEQWTKWRLVPWGLYETVDIAVFILSCNTEIDFYLTVLCYSQLSLILIIHLFYSLLGMLNKILGTKTTTEILVHNRNIIHCSW